MSCTPTDVFLDTFTGADAQLLAHAPDVAPSGFAWPTFDPSAQPLMVISGGHALAGPGSSGISNVEATGFTSLQLQFPYSIEAVAFIDATTPGISQIFFAARNQDGTHEAHVNYVSGTGPTFTLANSINGDDFGSDVSLASGGLHTFKILVEANQLSVSIDGGAYTVNSTAAQGSTIDVIDLQIASGVPGSSPPTAYIDSIRITQECPPDSPEVPDWTGTGSATNKGHVGAVGSLPSTGNTVHDAYTVGTNYILYVWDGSTWNGLASTNSTVSRVGSVTQFVQASPSSTWTITHGLNYNQGTPIYPVVDAYTVIAGALTRVMPSAVARIDDATCTLTFSAPISGFATFA